MDPSQAPGVDAVQWFLRGQNLEQLGRTDEAVELYERAVAATFDSPGPYDRLIQIYSHRAQHHEVIRVADAALAAVHTHADKRIWYERMGDSARAAATKVPSAATKAPAVAPKPD
jgi:tetratricopeptide (TPR) repeat protein